ncbi:MAG: hypothetical protein ACFN1J_07625, partial [Bacteroidota bacterium]
KYNILDYTLNKKIDLTGNAISLQIITGIIDATNRRVLKRLKYKYVKQLQYCAVCIVWQTEIIFVSLPSL